MSAEHSRPGEGIQICAQEVTSADGRVGLVLLICGVPCADVCPQQKASARSLSAPSRF